MSWDDVRGHETMVERFRTAAARGRLASTYLFIGPAGIGKRTFALELARALLCEKHKEAELQACGTCPSCVQVAASTHPDLIQVAKPEDRAFLPIELFIGDREHRMRAGLCHDISLRPSRGSRKVAIVDDADYFNIEGANCLLKTLEEPPPGSLLVLIGTSEQKQLPTIRSRSQVMRFAALSEQDVTELLIAEGLVADDSSAAELARHSQGSLALARQLASPEAQEFRRQLLVSLGYDRVDTTALSKLITDFVEAAGTDALPRRERMRQVAFQAANFYRQLLRHSCGAAAEDDREVSDAVRRAEAWWLGQETALECLDRCLEAQQQVDANANQANWIECLVDDLTRTAAGAR